MKYFNADFDVYENLLHYFAFRILYSFFLVAPSLMLWFIFQPADAILGQIDTAGAGLLSFSSFCQGVATLMGSSQEEVEEEREEKADKQSNGKIAFEQKEANLVPDQH